MSDRVTAAEALAMKQADDQRRLENDRIKQAIEDAEERGFQRGVAHERRLVDDIIEYLLDKWGDEKSGHKMIKLGVYKVKVRLKFLRRGWSDRGLHDARRGL